MCYTSSMASHLCKLVWIAFTPTVDHIKSSQQPSKPNSVIKLEFWGLICKILKWLDPKFPGFHPTSKLRKKLRFINAEIDMKTCQLKSIRTNFVCPYTSKKNKKKTIIFENIYINRQSQHAFISFYAQIRNI